MKQTTPVLSALAVLLAGVGTAHADPISVDFSSYADGTPLSSVNGISFSLIGGPGAAGLPVTGNGGLTNSTSGSYPTANILAFAFASPVSNVSFTFDNQGTGDFAQRGDSFVQAFDSKGNLLQFGSLNGASGGSFSLTASGIEQLQFNNNSGGTDSWIFDVGSIQADSSVLTTSATPTVPEPSSLVLLGVGVAGAAGYRWRRKQPATA